MDEAYLIKECRKLKNKGWKPRDIRRALCLDKKELKRYLHETDAINNASLEVEDGR